MKSYKKSCFTLIELMFVITVLVILISISWINGTKVIDKQIDRKMKAEIATLVKVIELYKIRYGAYPPNDTPGVAQALNFAEKLSSSKPGSGWIGKREMYINFKKTQLQRDYFCR